MNIKNIAIKRMNGIIHAAALCNNELEELIQMPNEFTDKKVISDLVPIGVQLKEKVESYLEQRCYANFS